jgi:hypothetical protein
VVAAYLPELESFTFCEKQRLAVIAEALRETKRALEPKQSFPKERITVKTLLKVALFVVAACSLIITAAGQDVVNTVIGGGPNGLPGKNANMYDPYQEAIDASGNIYVASYAMHRVFKISTAGVETVVAGNGINGYSGDGGPAVRAQLNYPEGVAVDGANPPNVYIADWDNCLVRKVNQTTGIITTVAGLVNSAGTSTSCGYSGDGGPANKAELDSAAGVAVNPATGDLYIADYSNGVVRKVAGGVPTGTITTVAGTPSQNCGGTAPYGDGGAATAAHLCNPDAVSIDTASPVNLYITELSRCTVREVVGSSKDIYQLAGSYTKGCGYNGDGINAVGAELYQPYQTRASVSGSTTTVDIADYANGRLRQFTLTYSGAVPKVGNISTVAGKGEGGWCDDDGGAALSACMTPVGIVYDSSGNFYISDYQADRIRKITKSSGLINTIFGWGPDGGTEVSFSNPVGISGVAGGTPSLLYPVAVYADPTSTKVYGGGYQGNAIYVWNSSTNTVSNFAGSGVYGFAGDGAAANSAAVELAYPWGVGKDSKGNIYIADYNDCAIREVVAATGNITTVVGGSPGALKGCGYTNTGAVDSQLDGPYAVTFDSANNMYIADYDNCAIRKLTASTGLVSTIAGAPPATRGCGFSGDGGPATAALIYYPQSVTVDGAGNVYFMEAQGTNTCRVREIVAQTGIIQTVVGDGSCGYSGDGSALGNSIYSGYVTADVNGNLFLSDYYNYLVRWVTPSGQMLTFAGTPQVYGYTGDGGPALKATFYYPAGIARDSAGNTYVADGYNQRIRQITPFAGYGLSMGNLIFETQPAGTVSDFQPVTVSAIGPTTISSITAPAGFSEIDDCVGQSLSVNQTCEIDVYFQPTAAGKVSGNLTIASNAFLAANPNKIFLTGTASGLKLTGTESFGAVPLKNPLAETLTLSNSGAAVTLTKIYLTSTTTAFSITGGTCPTGGGALASGASCTITVTFNPQTVGGFKSTLVVASNDPASPLLAQVTGTGTEVKLSASSIAFGTVTLGKTSTVNLTITNVGTASFTLAEAISGAGFSISSTGKTCTTSLAAGASCVLPVEYDPTAVGTNSGTLTLTTSGGSNPVIPLSGTCTSAASASLTTRASGTVTHGTGD